MVLKRATVCILLGAVLATSAAVADEERLTLPREVVTAADAFETYMNGAASIDGRFSGGGSVAQAVRTGSAYEPVQLEEGMIGYAAVAALHDQHFVEGVERAAGRGEGRRDLAEALIRDPFAATRIDGAAGAVHRIEAALAGKSAPVFSAGQMVKSAAYSVQHQAWSKVMVSDPRGRLAEVKALSASRFEASENDHRRMMRGLESLDPGADQAVAPAGVTPVEARALALAAEAVLGRGDDAARLSPLLTEYASADCLRMSKLNLYQCMAVAGPQYEDIFCLGQHALMDTGRCVAQSVQGGGAIVSRPAQSASNAVPYVTLSAHHSFRRGGQ
ncbi:MAG: hypothetical protein ACHP84_14340 [Caulobacterales bacterium]